MKAVFYRPLFFCLFYGMFRLDKNILMISILKIFLLLTLSQLFFGCASNGEKKDTSDLYAKSQTRQAIIERSGTTFRAGSDPLSKKEQLQDAQNRLQSGGGLFGKKGGISLLGGKGNENITSLGMPINPYLWKGGIETIEFMPLISADPFAGVILTDWYSSGNEEKKERCKVNIFIKGAELNTQNLKVNTFCQILNDENIWIDKKTDLTNNTKIENAIFNKAKKLRLASN